MEIQTERLLLRPWREEDLAPLAALQADPEVMADYGGPQSLEASQAKIDRYRDAFDAFGFTRWAVEAEGAFIGYVGVMPVFPGHPREPGYEVGWRLVRAAWGKGYATEAARASLLDVFRRAGLVEVLSYTAPDNRRSRAVMDRLGLTRRQELDFEHQGWPGMVWSAAADSYP
jgi:RimJ/RimL family protein N-acetyltransferase